MAKQAEMGLPTAYAQVAKLLVQAIGVHLAPRQVKVAKTLDGKNMQLCRRRSPMTPNWRWRRSLGLGIQRTTVHHWR